MHLEFRIEGGSFMLFCLSPRRWSSVMFCGEKHFNCILSFTYYTYYILNMAGIIATSKFELHFETSLLVVECTTSPLWLLILDMSCSSMDFSIIDESMSCTLGIYQIVSSSPAIRFMHKKLNERWWTVPVFFIVNNFKNSRSRV